MDRCDMCKHQDACVNVPYGCECFEIDLSKHDAQVRTQAIEEFAKCFKAKTTMEHKLVDEISKQLKEKQNENNS